MFKRLLSALSAVVCLILTLAACGDNTAESPSKSDSSSEGDSYVQTVPDEPKLYVNNLTGLEELDSKEKQNVRPVAVMINNIAVAQKVQTGLGSASIIYETYVEGGITRLLAVYKDLTDVGTIGSMRSARYSYIDLACGHDALYLHAGLDPNYTKKRMAKMNLDDYDLNTGYGGNYCFRVKNGLAREHTMFTNGELIYKGLEAGKRRMTVDEKHSGNWQNFADPDESVTLSGGSATKLSVFFSNSYITNFAYDGESKTYLKSNRTKPSVDADTGKQYGYKNVLVLFTTVGNFDDKYRVYSEMKGGEGYYFTNGTYMPVKWSKGDTYDRLKITDESGAAVKYSAGNSYVCITNKNLKSKTTFSGDAAAA